MSKKSSIHNNFDLLIFVIPVLLLILAMSEIPFILNIFYSFTKWNGLAKNPIFIGLSNFSEAILDANFQNSLLFTLQYTVFFMIMTNVLAIILALALDKPLRSKNIFRTVFFLPNVISLIIIGFIWRFIFTRGFDSLYNLTHFTFLNWSWLGDYKLAWITVVAVSVWQSVGYLMVIYIAGLQSISHDLLESAAIDGATGLRKFFTIIFPMIMPAVTVCTFLTIANGLKLFDIVYALTGGGPGNATTSVSLNIYRESFQNNRYGYGTAQAVLFFIVIFVITTIQVRAFKKMEVEL